MINSQFGLCVATVLIAGGMVAGMGWAALPVLAGAALIFWITVNP